MRVLTPAAVHVLAHPGEFVRRVLKGFKTNQGLLLAGAVAYYALLSVVPLLILAVIGLSHFVDQQELLTTMGRYLEWLVPGQSRAVIGELRNFVEHRDVIGWLLLVPLLFFSSLAFTVRRRHFLVSAVLPYCYILSLGFGMLVVTMVAGVIQNMGQDSLHFLGFD